MQYFVSIENTSFFYWQTELLIESFFAKNLQNDLVMGMAEEESPKFLELAKHIIHIINHPGKFLHHNYGAEKEYLPLNRPYSIINAMQTGVLKTPFALIHADMVLVKPIKKPDENVVFHMVDNPLVSQEIEPYLEKMLKSAEGFSRADLPARLPFNGVVIFNDVDVEFFWRVLWKTEELLKEKGPLFPCEKVAWSLCFYEMLEKMSFRGEYLECGLLEPLLNLDVNFVHYKHGIPPVFHKRNYTFRQQTSFSGNVSPYELLMEFNPTTATHHVQQVLRSYRQRQNESKKEPSPVGEGSENSRITQTSQ